MDIKRGLCCDASCACAQNISSHQRANVITSGRVLRSFKEKSSFWPPDTFFISTLILKLEMRISLDAFDPVDGNYPRKNLITSFKVGNSNSIMLKMMKWPTVERTHFHNSMLRCIRFWGSNCAKNRINQSINIYTALETWALHIRQCSHPLFLSNNSVWELSMTKVRFFIGLP